MKYLKKKLLIYGKEKLNIHKSGWLTKIYPIPPFDAFSKYIYISTLKAHEQIRWSETLIFR